MATMQAMVDTPAREVLTMVTVQKLLLSSMLDKVGATAMETLDGEMNTAVNFTPCYQTTRLLWQKCGMFMQ